MSTHTILCGFCGTPVGGPDTPEDEDKITCPKCGQSDTYAAVVEYAQRYVTDRFTKSLNSTMADAVKGSKYVKFTPGHIPNRNYRWTIADFDL